MNKWKRIAVFTLALSLVISSFSLLSFSVFAYDNPSQCSLQLPGFGTIGLVNGIAGGSKGFLVGDTVQSISNLYVVNPKHNDYFQFCIWFGGTDIPSSVFSYVSTSGSSINNDEWIVVKRPINVPLYNSDGSLWKNVAGLFITVKYIGSDYSGTKNINLGCSITVRNTANAELYPNGIVGFAYLSNVTITSDVTLILQNILNTENDIYDDLNNFLYGSDYGLWPYYYSMMERTSGYISDIRRKMTVLSTFDYVSITYDNDGNVTTGTAKTTWYEALLNSINSLTMPFKEQVEREQQAKDAGAQDALDTAYDSVGSSFGALGDFSGLGSLATFDGDTLGSAGTGGLLSWFSQENANAIDAVPKSRQPDNIIDFYTDKIEQYREEVSSDDGSTDN